MENPGQYVLKKLFADFVQLSTAKLTFISTQDLDYVVTKCLQRGEDPYLDQVCMCICVSVCTCICMVMYIRMCTRTYIRTYICTNVRMYVRICMHVYMQVHTYACTYICICMYGQYVCNIIVLYICMYVCSNSSLTR